MKLTRKVKMLEFRCMSSSSAHRWSKQCKSHFKTHTWFQSGNVRFESEKLNYKKKNGKVVLSKNENTIMMSRDGSELLSWELTMSSLLSCMTRRCIRRSLSSSIMSFWSLLKIRSEKRWKKIKWTQKKVDQSLKSRTKKSNLLDDSGLKCNLDRLNLIFDHLIISI